MNEKTDMTSAVPRSGVTRRDGLAFGAAAISLIPVSALSATQADPTHSTESSMTEQAAIRPLQVKFAENELTELRRRLKMTRWPERELVADATQGVQLATMQKLVDYWANEHDWSKCEARLAALPNFVTEIDGLNIHFIHVRSKHESALPVIITHGWPGSVLEQLKIVAPLTDPTAHGGTAADAFHVVIPSMPGYGLSGKPAAPGWGPERIASAWFALMNRLGYEKYVAQGGDWGALITQLMGAKPAPELIGIHTNMPGAVPPDIDKAAFAGGPVPAGLSEDERRAYDQLVYFYTKGLSYAQEMGHKPQTLYGIADSPAGLAAWIIDHDIDSYKMIARVFDGEQEGLSRDDVLDNITFYWLTNTAISSARLYWENKFAFFAPKGVKIPAAISAYPTEIYTAPKNWVEKAFPNLIHYNKLPKGGHFAAWEQPGYFVSELRDSFRQLRKTV